jgi:hypothetical protein
MKEVAIVVIAVIFVIVLNVVLTKLGHPNAVWLYCDMLNWCHK